MGEIIWIVSFIALMTLPFLILKGKGRWLWFGTMALIMIGLIIWIQRSIQKDLIEKQ